MKRKGASILFVNDKKQILLLLRHLVIIFLHFMAKHFSVDHIFASCGTRKSSFIFKAVMMIFLPSFVR